MLKAKELEIKACSHQDHPMILEKAFYSLPHSDDQSLNFHGLDDNRTTDYINRHLDFKRASKALKLYLTAKIKDNSKSFISSVSVYKTDKDDLYLDYLLHEKILNERSTLEEWIVIPNSLLHDNIIPNSHMPAGISSIYWEKSNPREVLKCFEFVNKKNEELIDGLPLKWLLKNEPQINHIFKFIEDNNKTIEEKTSIVVDWMYEKLDESQFSKIALLIKIVSHKLAQKEDFTQHNIIASILILSRRFNAKIASYIELKNIFHGILIKNYGEKRAAKIFKSL